jgi:hypothetical protein
MNKTYKLNVDCWFYCHTAWALLSFFKSPPPCHVPVTKPRENCTKCLEGLVSNILQGDSGAFVIFCLDFLVSYRYKGLNLLLLEWKWLGWKSNKAELLTTDTG